MQSVCAEYLYLLFTQVVSAWLGGSRLPTKLVPFWSFYAKGVIINPSPLSSDVSAFHAAFQLSTLGVKLSGKLGSWSLRAAEVETGASSGPTAQDDTTALSCGKISLPRSRPQIMDGSYQPFLVHHEPPSFPAFHLTFQLSTQLSTSGVKLSGKLEC